jgi:hypothetical protein
LIFKLAFGLDCCKWLIKFANSCGFLWTFFFISFFKNSIRCQSLLCFSSLIVPAKTKKKEEVPQIEYQSLQKFLLELKFDAFLKAILTCSFARPSHQPIHLNIHELRGSKYLHQDKITRKNMETSKVSRGSSLS